MIVYYRFWLESLPNLVIPINLLIKTEMIQPITNNEKKVWMSPDLCLISSGYINASKHLPSAHEGSYRGTIASSPTPAQHKLFFGPANSIVKTALNSVTKSSFIS